MSRRVIAPKRFCLAALASAVIFLSLLPGLGWVWHRVLPEHQHWLVGAAHGEPISAECAECAGDGAARLHLPDFSGFPVIILVIGPGLVLEILIADEFSRRVAALSFILSSPDLPRFDPPPKGN